MKRDIRSVTQAFVGAASLAVLAACNSGPQHGGPASATKVQVTSGAGGAWTSEPAVEKNLATFDTLDFDVYSNQKWNRLEESHSQDITVTWPDGHETHGIAKHIEDLKAQFAFAPNTRIKQHPIKLGVGAWSSVMGSMEGTFTKPMTIADGTVVQPTNKAFKISMVTIGHWTSEGVMDHEWLFWDNADFGRQIGLRK